jgi:hypothetical protein
MKQMKLPPPVTIGGSTPAERLDLALRKVLTVSKSELLREEAKLKQARTGERGKEGVSGKQPHGRNKPLLLA